MEIKYLIGLFSLPGLGQKRLKLMVDYFHSFEYAWQKVNIWHEIPGMGNCQEMLAARKNCDLEKVYEQFLQAEAKVVTLTDPEYPYYLKNIYDPPYLLFYRGILPRELDLTVGMVGSRRATAYGKSMAQKLAHELARKGAWVVSGLARGIDTSSHRGSLAGGGKTIAVLGSGIDVIYPAENRDLYHRITKSGAVVSELPLGTPPFPQHFPARNRIISGISRGVVVVEAAQKSGSLITVDFALDQGRDVFAVPGPASSPLSHGTHQMIRQGAKLVERVEDIWEEYYPEEAAASSPADLFSFTGSERRILELLWGQEVYFDDIVEQSGLSASELAALLTLWEIRGLVKQLPGKYYITENLGG